MSVERRVKGGRVRWIARWREDDRQVARTFDRKADAVEFEAAQRRRAQLGAHAPAAPSRERLGEWLLRWWDRDAVTWARSTRLQRGGVIDKWISPYLKGARLRDLGPARVAEWRAAIVADGCPPTQANAALSVLSAALGAAAKDGLLPANPCTGTRRLTVAVRRPRALTPLEVERIRAEMPTLRDIVLLGLMAYAGHRPEEAFALTWGSAAGPVLVVDRSFTAGELKVTKTRRRRTVEIVGPLADDLALLRPKVADPDALVCPGRMGQPLDLRNWRRRVWQPACERAGVKATPYDGRHTYASLLIHEGRSIPYVTAALGHASATTTLDHYAHLFDASRLAPMAPMVESIVAARGELRAAGVYPACTQNPVRVLRAPRPGRENGSVAGAARAWALLGSNQ